MPKRYLNKSILVPGYLHSLPVHSDPLWPDPERRSIKGSVHFLSQYHLFLDLYW